MNKVSDDGEDSTSEEEEDQTAVDYPLDTVTMKNDSNHLLVDLTLGELPGGADDTPDDRGSTENLSTGADEVVFLCGSAHVFDICEHPGLDTKLNSSSDDGGENLGKEQCLGSRSVDKYDRTTTKAQNNTYGIFM